MGEGGKPQILYNDVIRNFRKGTFHGTKNEKLEAGVCLARNQYFAEGEGLELQVKKFYKNIKIGTRVEQISATQTCHRREG